MKLSELLEGEDYLVAYDITDPKGINRSGTGYKGKQRFKTKLEAKASFGRDNEDIVVSGDWVDYTGSADIGDAKVMMQGAGNKIQGQTGWVKGARPDTVTKRGKNVDTHRTRQHLQWIEDGRC